MLSYEEIPVGAQFIIENGLNVVYTKKDRSRSVDPFDHDYWSGYFDGKTLIIQEGKFVTQHNTQQVIQYKRGNQSEDRNWEKFMDVPYACDGQDIVRELRQKNADRDTLTRLRPGQENYRSVSTNFRLVQIETKVTILDQDYEFDAGV